MKKIFLTVMVLSLSVGLLLAATATGFVTDQTTGEGIENAFVKFKLINANGNGNGNGNHGNGGGNGGGGDCDGTGSGPHNPSNPDGNINRLFTATTDATGAYIIEDLPEGTYLARAGKQLEYRMLLVRDIEVSEENINQDFALTPHISVVNRFKTMFKLNR
ncbi:MAG: carboxypeptidase-like regulatory domain-containing protein [Candidatus Cloacimonetes bacterium]|jgi:hypothetical protein|nr:carboxypeptidase-like regulatory domain-containing protein [Candidatus Cloacimonadota bacterium]